MPCKVTVFKLLEGDFILLVLQQLRGSYGLYFSIFFFLAKCGRLNRFMYQILSTL